MDSTAMQATVFGDILPHVMNINQMKNLANRRKCGERSECLRLPRRIPNIPETRTKHVHDLKYLSPITQHMITQSILKYI